MPVNSFKRGISYILILIFGLLSLKVLFPGFGIVRGNCQEFAHFHFYNPMQNPSVSDGYQLPSEDGCHEGKSILSYSPFPAGAFQAPPLQYQLVFELVFNITNPFANPDLEPHRKPPRIS